MKKVLGIDIGTTSICLLVLDIENGITLKTENVTNDSFLTSNFKFERIENSKYIIDQAMSLIDKNIDEDVIAIGVTGQMHGIVYFDKNGELVSDLYTWQDKRSAEVYKDNKTYAEFLGTFVGYGNATDFYNRVNNIIPESAFGYCTIADYLVMKLTNSKCPKIHSTNAAGFGLYDYENNKFSYEFASKVEIFKDLVVAGNYKGIPISIAIGDNQASVLGAIKNQNDLLLNIGTGGQVSFISDVKVNNENIEVRPYFENKYLLVGCSLCSGKAYSVLKNFYKDFLDSIGLKNVDIYKAMDTLVSKEGEPLEVDTRFDGTRANEEIKGSIKNISSSSFNPVSLTKGFLNGIVNELFSISTPFLDNVNSVICSGNAIRKNKYLFERVSLLFAKPAYITSNLEEAAFGAALSSLVATKQCDNVSEVGKYINYL